MRLFALPSDDLAIRHITPASAMSGSENEQLSAPNGDPYLWTYLVYVRSLPHPCLHEPNSLPDHRDFVEGCSIRHLVLWPLSSTMRLLSSALYRARLVGKALTCVVVLTTSDLGVHSASRARLATNAFLTLRLLLQYDATWRLHDTTPV
jgi:hypothetical protein